MEKELHGFIPEEEITADAVIVNESKPVRFDKRAEEAEEAAAELAIASLKAITDDIDTLATDSQHG